MSGGKGGTPATSTQSSSTQTAPWSGALPYITSGLQSAQDLYNQGGPSYYPGETYALPNSGELSAVSNLSTAPQTFAPLLQTGTSAVNNAVGTSGNVTSNDNSIFSNANDIYNSSQGIADTANSIGQEAMNNPSNSFFQGLTDGTSTAPGFSTLEDYSNGKYLSADNPYFKQMADTITAQVLPGIQAPFAASGRGTSGLAARAASEGLGDSIGQLAYNNYQQGLTQQQNAANSLTGLATTGANGLSNNFNTGISNQLNAGNLGLNAGNLGISAGNLGLGAGTQAISAGNLGLNAAQTASMLQAMGLSADQAQLLAGQTLQGYNQAQDTDAQTRYNYNAQLPYQNLQNYIANITGQLQGTGSTTGSSTGTSTPAQPAAWQQALQTGLAAASFFA